MNNTSVNIGEVLSERGNRYGDFSTHAEITQQLMYTCEMLCKQIHKCPLNQRLNYSQVESLHMIFHKIGRIINGDPNYADSWIDIAGYAQLIVDELNSYNKDEDD